MWTTEQRTRAYTGFESRSVKVSQGQSRSVQVRRVSCFIIHLHDCNAMDMCSLLVRLSLLGRSVLLRVVA